MPLCDCGALVARYIVHTETPDGTPLNETRTTCPECHPEEFPEQPFAMSLDRIVTGPEAFPNKYKLGEDGIYRPTDSSLQDDFDLMKDGPTSKAENLKRQTRRTTPMTQEEIDRAMEWGENYIAPRRKTKELDYALRNGSATDIQLH